MFKLDHWRFDFFSSFIGIVAVPLTVLAFRSLYAYLAKWLMHVLDGVMYYFGRYIIRSLSVNKTTSSYTFTP